MDRTPMLPDAPARPAPTPPATVGDDRHVRDDRDAVPVSDAVRAARALLPRLYAGDDVAAEANRLASGARALGDPEAECAALYSALAAAGVNQDLPGARRAVTAMIEVARDHDLAAWESTARQYEGRLMLAGGHEASALSGVVEAELLVDDSLPSVGLAVALNGIGVTYSRLGIFEDSERVFARLQELNAEVDDAWIQVALGYNRPFNQASWGLALLRTGATEDARQRLSTAADQARGSVTAAHTLTHPDFGALNLFTELMTHEVGIEVARERLAAFTDRCGVEALSFVRFALAHRLADAGAHDDARSEITLALDRVDALEGEPAYSMLTWERARVAVLQEPDHAGLRDAWDYAQLATAQVWELRIRRREAAQDRLRIGRMRREHERVEKASLEDPLTGTANRRRVERARKALDDATDTAWVTVGYLDIDRFKEINDTYGHELGDTVLCELAALLQTSVRDDDLVGRYGGDEFVFIARDCDPIAAGRLSGRLIAAVREHPWSDLRADLRVRISMGLASAHRQRDRLFPAADEALYAAKRAGRDRAEVRVLPEPAADA